MAHEVKDQPTEFDRTGRGFPSFGYRLRKLEQRVRSLEAALAMTSSDTDRRNYAEYTSKEKTDDRDANR